MRYARIGTRTLRRGWQSKRRGPRQVTIERRSVHSLGGWRRQRTLGPSRPALLGLSKLGLVIARGYAADDGNQQVELRTLV